MTLDYRSTNKPTARGVPSLRDVGRSLIALGAVQRMERHPRWPTTDGMLYFGWCFVSGLTHIICGMIIRKRLVPLARWIAAGTGTFLSAIMIWEIAILIMELFSGSGPAQKFGIFFVIFILIGLGIIGSFAYICWQMHVIAKSGAAQHKIIEK